MQTSRETIAALLSGGRAERVGLYESIWPDTLEMWVADGYPVDAEGKPKNSFDVFEYDLGRLGGAFDPSPWPGQYICLEQTDEWEIIVNSAGVTQKVWRNKSAPAGPIAWQLTGPKEWEAAFKPQFLRTDASRVPSEELRQGVSAHREANRWLCFNMSFIWENFRQAVGDVCIYESLVLDPEWVKDYNRTTLDFYIRHFDLAFDNACVPDGVWLSEDLAYNQGLFCSPRVLETLVFPYYRAFNDYLHGKGLKVILHSCGNIEQALPMIVEAGFDALHPLQVHAGCDPLSIARRYGDRLALLGGLDTHLLERGNAAEIEDAQVRLMDGMRDAGARYIFSSDHSISTNVAYDTYRRVIDTYHKRRGR